VKMLSSGQIQIKSYVYREKVQKLKIEL